MIDYRLISTCDHKNGDRQTYSYSGPGDRVRVNKPTRMRPFVYDSQGRVIAEYGASSAKVKAKFIWAVPPGVKL